MKPYNSLPIEVQQAVNRKKKKICQRLVDFSAGGTRRVFPWREATRSPYEVLIAEMLLKRTTATAVARVYEAFLQQFPSLKTLNDAPGKEVEEALSPLGLQRQRAVSLKRLAQYLVENEAGMVPSDLPSLLNTPGIGDYSSRAILSFAYGIPAAVVDSNVERIFQRVFQKTLAKRPTRTLFQILVDKIMPIDKHDEFNLGMLDLGALVCRPVKPRCDNCPLLYVCDYANPIEETKKSLIYASSREDMHETFSSVRTMRKKKGFSLVELSKRAGISKLTLIKIESGRTHPKRGTLEKLASALEIQVEDINRS